MKIYCPRCRWEPPAQARWRCTCGHAWNTFETQGRCPRCGKVWLRTQCLACHEWSPHHDWYHDLPPVDALEELETRTIDFRLPIADFRFRVGLTRRRHLHRKRRLGFDRPGFSGW